MKTIVKNKEINYKRELFKYIFEIEEKVDLKDKLGGYIQHGKTSVYTHVRNVAYISLRMAHYFENKFKKKIDYNSLMVGVMFHDFFLYDWHDPNKCADWHGFTHPAIASKNAQQEYNINELEKQIIESHMWPLTITKYPKSLEAKIVCIADKICSAKETINRF